MKIVKVNSLPQSFEADTIYIVKSSTAGLMDFYVTDNTGTQIRSLAIDTAAVNSLLQVSEVGVTVASLVDGKIPTNQLPSAILGTLTYQDTWNASTNAPTIPAASPSNKGWYYVVNTAGTASIGGIDDWQIGDWLVSNGVSWGKIDNSDKVSSVAGKTGAVTLSSSDVGLGNVDDTSDADKPVSTATQTALDGKQASLGFTPVQQGGGTEQGTNKIFMGWDDDQSTGLRIQVDSTDFGNSWPVSITKNAATATKLATARTINGVNFDGTANISVPVGWSSVTGKPAVIAAGTDVAAARAAIGAASLVGGKIPEHELPALAITDVFPVASEAAMLALTAEKGDMAIRSDLNKCFVLSAAPASTPANWLELKTPANAVLSVAGRTGAITLSSSDVGLGNVDDTSDANKPVSSAAQTALNLKAPLESPELTGVPSAPTAGGGTNTTQIATTAYVFAERTNTATLTNKTLTSPIFNDGYTEEVFAVTGTTPVLTPIHGSIQTWTLTGNSTPTVDTWGSGQSMTLMVDDGSAYTINWASMSITWKTGGGTAPTLLATGYTVIELTKIGTTIYGWLAGDA